MNPEPHRGSELDLWEFQQFQERLKDWVLTGQHHMHKSWQFLNAQQALQWYAIARELSDSRGRDCCFYLGHVGAGRVETDIFNRIQGHLTRDDLDVAVIMNTISDHVRNQCSVPDQGFRRHLNLPVDLTGD